MGTATEEPEVVITPNVQAELLALADQSPGGLLRPETVVAFAKEHPDSAIAKEGGFEWDVEKAAHQHWIDQARRLIRAQITILPQQQRKIRAFLSVPTDRLNGDGYRRTDRALNNNALRMQLVEEAVKAVEGMPQRFNYLPELDPLWAEVRAAVSRFREAAAAGIAAA